MCYVGARGVGGTRYEDIERVFEEATSTFGVLPENILLGKKEPSETIPANIYIQCLNGYVCFWYRNGKRWNNWNYEEE